VTQTISAEHSSSLAAFIKRVEPVMMDNLRENNNTKAFTGLEGMLAAHSATATNTHSLNHAALQGEYSALSISWNPVGSVIGIAYGKHDHENWCTHKGMFCTWNLDRGKINPNKADLAVDVSSCLMTVEFHPVLPNLCAGGAFDGQVIVWDLSRTDDIEVCISKHIEDGHHEPVSRLQWVHEGKNSKLISLGMDGKVLVWEVRLSKLQNPEMVLVQGFVLSGRAIPRGHPAAPTNRNTDIGGTCMSFSREDSSVFVVGTESGGVMKCSTLSKEIPMDRGVKVQFHSPVTLVYNPHSGPVYQTHFSPFHRNLFLTASTDCTMRLYNALQPKPFQVLEPVAGYVFSVQWSPVRPLVFAASTSNGSLLIYDLKVNRICPVLTIPAYQTKSPVYCVAFNPKSCEVLCSADGKGMVKVWRLSSSLTSQLAGEEKMLERLAASSYD